VLKGLAAAAAGILLAACGSSDPSTISPPTSAASAASATVPGAPSGSASPSPTDPGAAPTCSYAAEQPNTGSKPAPGLPPQPTRTSGTATISLVLAGKPLVITVDAAKTPCTLASFMHLAGKHYFDGTTCHRLTTEGIFVLQCGDPTGTGSGGPGYTLPEENLGQTALPAGTVAMAKTQAPHSTGSQFFLVYAASQLPPQYTPFGIVTTGLDVLRAIGRAGTTDGGPDGAPKEPATITTLRVS
jgi:peptidyl-prolyl cis-trans isomerase B (cyclophilin B)